MTAHAGLAPGERAPDFIRPRADGRAATFYEDWCGRPLVLAVLTGAADADRLDRLRHRFAGRPDVGCALLLPPGMEPPAGWPPASLIPDDGAVARALLGDTVRDDAILVFDATLRLAATVQDADAADGVLAGLGEGETAPIRAIAPVLTVPDVLDAALCTRLIAAWRADNAESGMVRLRDGQPVLVPDPEAKRRRDHMLTDPSLTEAVLTALQRRVLPEIAKAFAFQVQGYERLKVVAYDAEGGGYFRPHRDNTTPDAAHRRFALTLTLNDDYRGGWLRFPEYGAQRYRPAAGGAIVFSCAHLHELTDVTAGRRFALLSFFF